MNTPHTKVAFYSNGRYIELGSDSGNTTCIDFHSNAANTTEKVDYEARIICSIGSTRNAAGGNFIYYVATQYFLGTVTLPEQPLTIIT